MARPLRHTVIAIFRNSVLVWQIGEFADIDISYSILSFPPCRHNHGKLIPLARTSHARLWPMNEIRGWIRGDRPYFASASSSAAPTNLPRSYSCTPFASTTFQLVYILPSASQPSPPLLYNTIRRTTDVTLLTSHVELARCMLPLHPPRREQRPLFRFLLREFLVSFLCTPIRHNDVC